MDANERHGSLLEFPLAAKTDPRDPLQGGTPSLVDALDGVDPLNLRGRGSPRTSGRVAGGPDADAGQGTGSGIPFRAAAGHSGKCGSAYFRESAARGIAAAAPATIRVGAPWRRWNADRRRKVSGLPADRRRGGAETGARCTCAGRARPRTEGRWVGAGRPVAPLPIPLKRMRCSAPFSEGLVSRALRSPVASLPS